MSIRAAGRRQGLHPYAWIGNSSLTGKKGARNGRNGEDVSMKIHLDTENIKEIQEVESLGMLDGVTTNPSRVVKEGKARLWAKRRPWQSQGWGG